MEILLGLGALAVLVILGISLGELIMWVFSLVASYVDERRIRREEIQEEKDKLWEEVLKIEAEKDAKRS